MLIPPDALAPDTLRALCEEFVSRDGTQTGDLREAAEKVMRMLRDGRAVLCFEEATESEDGGGDGEGPSCQVLMREEWEKREREKK